MVSFICFNIYVLLYDDFGWYYFLFCYWFVVFVVGFWFVSWGVRFVIGWIVGSGVVEYG